MFCFEFGQLHGAGRGRAEKAKAAGVPAFPNDYRRDVLATHLLAEYGDKPTEWFDTNTVRLHTVV